jgi:4-hydroxybenzoate polyprenyltransferase
MYVCFMGRILLKDFRDYEGDKKFGKLNFLVRHGPKATCLLAALCWIAGNLIFTISFFNEFQLLVLIVQPIIIAICYSLYKLAHEKRYQHKLVEVTFIRQMGNAIAVSLLAALTLRAFEYSIIQKNLITFSLAGFFVLSALTIRADTTSKLKPQVR